MSIFPKRTIAGSNVTIHWNFNTTAIIGEHLCPFVSIGVIDPLGNITMLLEEYVLVLPSITKERYGDPNKNPTTFLEKNIPLMLLADYLSGRQKREKLVEILENIQSGRHSYFTYVVPENAVPGKYKLLSEVHIDGVTKYSRTAEEDFFYVEKITITSDDKVGTSNIMITNHSPEPSPVKIISYQPGCTITNADIQILELSGNESKKISNSGKQQFLSYNEERIIIPLHDLEGRRCVRNQQLLSTNKKLENDELIYVMHKEKELGFKLTGATKDIWMKADGITTKEDIRTESNYEAYDEMIANQLIFEI